MIRLFFVIAIMCFCANQSEKRISRKNAFYIGVVVTYALYVGLRTGYNDTWNYIAAFKNALPLSEFLNDPDSMQLTHNPLFYGFFSWTRGLTSNYHIVFMAVAVLNSILLVRFIQENCYGEFSFAILLFWTLGIGMFGLAAMKQITAMSILTLAYNAMLKKRWVRFILVVAIASLIHTYAILFFILPFLQSEPWNKKTMLILGGTIIVMLTFTTTVSTMMDYMETVGKSVISYEVFDGHGMNLFRVVLYSIAPVLLYVFRKRLVPEMDKKQYILSNMSIISFMFILLASVNGANMFGRLATYFLLGSVCMLGWMLNIIFPDTDNKTVYAIVSMIFLVFIAFDNVGIDGYGGYTSISLIGFLLGEV